MEPCYLCHHPTKTFLVAKHRSILRCNKCKIIYTTDLSPKNGIIREDSKKFVSEYIREAPLYEKYFDSIIEIIQKHTMPTSLLDVGCGIGMFLKTVKKVGWKSIGVDMSASAVAYARSQDLTVRLGKIEDQKFARGSFDVITLFQTVEHIEDPIKTLKKIHSLLRKGGILVLTTPSEESLMAKILGKWWFGYRNIEHLYFFNKRSLAFMQEKAGFKKIIIQSENGRILSLPWVLTRVFEYYYNQEKFLTTFILKSKLYWKYLNWITFREPDVNLVSVAIK